MNVHRLAPILAAKMLSADALELVHDQADLVYVVEAEGSQWVAYRVCSPSRAGCTYGFIEDRDEPQFTDEAEMLARFEAMIRSEYGSSLTESL